jgi:rhodanese-related sulfurtransferase
MMNAQGYTEIQPDRVMQLAATGALVIDVRTESEVAQGVIDGAMHIPLHLLPLRSADVSHDKPVVIYCRTGARSAQACAYMAGQGFSNMHNLAGGIMAWARSGNALSLPH